MYVMYVYVGRDLYLSKEIYIYACLYVIRCRMVLQRVCGRWNEKINKIHLLGAKIF